MTSSSCRALGLALVCVAMAGSAAWAQGEIAEEDLVGQQHEVQDRLAVERAALGTLKDQQTSLLTVIELIERRARVSEQRAASLDRELKALRKRRELAVRQEEIARSWMQQQVDELSPRLRAMYRLQRRSRLDVLLSASDFSSMVWRSRALSRIVDRELDAVRETRRAIVFQRQSQQALERLETAVVARGQQLAFERELSTKQQELLTTLLGRVGADAKETARLVRELEQAERRLARMVDDFDSELDSSTFAQSRGELPWPTSGMIEVAFGKVVNPRFNTVTFQKGLDIRARAGVPVLAVAPGKVVYAGWMRGYGNLLIVDHGSGYHSLMAHLADFSAGVGDTVDTGDELGHVGDTGSLKGSYLYFEIRKNGIAIDPADWLGEPEM